VEAVEQEDLIDDKIMALPGLDRPHMASMAHIYSLPRSALECMDAYQPGSEIKLVSATCRYVPDAFSHRSCTLPQYAHTEW